MTASTPPPYPQQPYPYGPPPMRPPASPSDAGGLFRLLAGIFGALAAVLVIVGSFLPQTTFEQIVGGKTESSQTISAWSRSFAVEPGDEARKFYENTHVAHYGIPLTVAAVILLAGAGLAFAGARRSAAARTALLVGGAGVAAAVWMLGMDVSATLSYESADDSVKSHYSTGTGFWLLLGSGVLAVAALAFALLAGRRAKTPARPQPGPYGGPGYPQQQSRPYPAGPQQPGGYPLPQQYQAAGPQSQPFPAQQPYGGPQSQPFPAQPGGPQQYPAAGPQSDPFPAQPAGPQQYQPGGPQSEPFPAQEPADAPEVTQAQPHPGEQHAGEPSPQPASPTEPNYQLPPLNPPKT